MITVPRNVHGIASAVRVKLMYTETALTNAAQGYLTLRANDLFDPLAATSGITGMLNQQPQYVDTWKLMYSKYRVLGSTLNVRLVNAPTNAMGIFFEASPEDALVTSSSAVQASVARFAAPRFFPNGPSTPALTVNKTMTTAQINGIHTNEVLSDPNYQAVFTATPADPWYWQMRYTSLDSTTTASVYIFVHVTFDCVFSDPTQDDDND